MRARTLLPLLFLLTTGCAKPIVVNAFDGPDRPDTEIATLELDFKARVTHLDGQPVPGLPAGLNVADPSNPRILRLLPGEHEMLVGLRPYVETHSYPEYSYFPTTDCHGHVSSHAVVTSWHTSTTHHPGSREDERIVFALSPGQRYRLKLDDPVDWFSRRERWSARVIEKTDAWRDPVVSASLGRQPHPPPTKFEAAPLPREWVEAAAALLARAPAGQPAPTGQGDGK
jgi:hypothetical protein